MSLARNLSLGLAVLLLGLSTSRADDKIIAKGPPVLRSAKSGNWSAGDTWEGGKVPGKEARVQVRPGHAVTYDVHSDAVIRSIHVGGTLTFSRTMDTRLDVGLI